MRDSWDPIWGEIPDSIESTLLASIGGGLVDFLWVDRGRRLVAKSPSVKRLRRFSALFPTAPLLLLVRDGRDVAQSAMSTFGWDLDTAARRWAAGVDEIVDFQQEPGMDRERYRLVRYEDLLADLEGTLRGVFDFLGLEAAAYDFAAAHALPVRGSSSHRGQGHSEVHWDPVAVDPSFHPVQRWRSWPEGQLARFEWLAAPQLRAMGYEPATGPVRGAGRLGQRWRDVTWWTRHGVAVGAFLARSRLGAATRPARLRLGLVRD